MKPGLNGISRLISAIRNSLRGIYDAWVHEAAFRQDVSVAIFLLPISVWLAQSIVEWLILILPLFLLVIVELLNSAVENTVDRIGAGRHPLSGRAKDMASAAVMFCLILIATTWLALAWSRFHV